MNETHERATPQSTHDDVCRIFVSRKKDDSRVVDKEIQEQLETFAPYRLVFFDDQDIDDGHPDWEEKIRQQLNQATILLLVLTRPAKKNFDWPLYEAGLFQDISGSQHKRVICLHPEGGKPPRQLAKRQATEATRKNILRLLGRLYRDAKFSGTKTALSPKLKDSQLAPMVEAIYKEINGKFEDELADLDYGNPYFQIVLGPGQTSLAPEVEISSDEHSLEKLFDLPAKPPRGGTWTWGDVEAKTTLSKDPKSFNRRWIAQLCDEVAVRRGAAPARASRQLTGRYLARDGELYRPEIEVSRVYKNGTMRIDVTFSQQVQDEWLRSSGAPVALASMISLASRIRHELIDQYLEKLPVWSGEEIAEGFEQLRVLDEIIEADGFFINRLSKAGLGRAFVGHRDEQKKLGVLYESFETKIRPDLAAALEELDVDKALEALEAWKKNNKSFLQIGLKVYADLLGLPEAA